MTDHELYKTPRIVPNKIFGILPTSIAKIFGKISQREIDEENDTTNYYRYGTMYGINSFIDAVARAIGNNRFENIIMKDKHIFQKLGKKWLLIHILDCQGKKLMI